MALPNELLNGSAANREGCRRDLVERCVLVRRSRQYGPWSSGELAAVAFLLEDTTMLAALEEDEESVLSRWAFDLFGITGGEEDRQVGWTRTRSWFLDTQARLDRNGDGHPTGGNGQR